MDKLLFMPHPVHGDYEASEDGIIRHRQLQGCIGSVANSGCLKISIWAHGKKKKYYSARFIWECYNGLIPPGLVIDHINRIRVDNRLENLRVVTPQQNCSNRTRGIKLKQRWPVIGVTDEQDRYFSSTCSAGKYYDVHPASIKYVADNIRLAAYSKRFQCWVSFIYQ